MTDRELLLLILRNQRDLAEGLSMGNFGPATNGAMTLLSQRISSQLKAVLPE